MFVLEFLLRIFYEYPILTVGTMLAAGYIVTVTSGARWAGRAMRFFGPGMAVRERARPPNYHWRSSDLRRSGAQEVGAKGTAGQVLKSKRLRIRRNRFFDSELFPHLLFRFSSLAGSKSRRILFYLLRSSEKCSIRSLAPWGASARRNGGFV